MPLRKTAPPVPLDKGAPATEPQTVFGAEPVDGGVAQFWNTPHGPVVLIHPTVERTGFRWRTWTEQFDSSRALIVVGYGVNPSGGPDLYVHDFALADTAQRYEIDWGELNALIGQPAPYWAPCLRTRSGMSEWELGEPVRTVAAHPGIDVDAVLRLAARHSPDTALHRTLVAFARQELEGAHDRAARDLELHREHQRDTAIAFAAKPAAVHASTDAVDLATAKAGWLHVLDLDDDDAYAAVMALCWTGADETMLPASAIATIEPDADGASDFIARLEPTGRTARTALFGDRARRTFLDPATGAAVAQDDWGTWHATIPARLPTPSPLAAVELQPDHVWIICEDGTRYLCPEVAGHGVAWGYTGSGPGRLAQTVHALLEDINIDVTLGLAEAPAGLEALCEHAWEPGTVFTREQLEIARDLK